MDFFVCGMISNFSSCWMRWRPFQAVVIRRVTSASRRLPVTLLSRSTTAATLKNDPSNAPSVTEDSPPRYVGLI